MLTRHRPPEFSQLGGSITLKQMDVNHGRVSKEARTVRFTLGSSFPELSGNYSGVIESIAVGG